MNSSEPTKLHSTCAELLVFVCAQTYGPLDQLRGSYDDEYEDDDLQGRCSM
jgi:hypothetical protein